MVWLSNIGAACRVPSGARAMLTLSFLLLCAAGCRQPLEPHLVPPAGLRPSQAIATDSACRAVTITLVGSNNLTVAFPDRTQCGSGLIVIPGGTPTRNGPGKRNVNLPVRLLNASGHTTQLPAQTVLAPGDRVVLAPTGQPGTKLIPQNADSVRAGTGAWVWLVGAAGLLPVNDSTAARTLVIRLDSPVTTGAIVLTMDGVQYATGGPWILLTSTLPTLDTTRLILRGGTEYFRTEVALRFRNTVSDTEKQAFFVRLGLEVIGVTVAEQFFVRFSDPGTSLPAFDAAVASLRDEPEVASVSVLARSLDPGTSARFPNDASGGQTRPSWLSGAQSVWAMRAIRAPEAWGCETGAYGSTAHVGLIEWQRRPTHLDLVGSSVPGTWGFADSPQISIIPAKPLKTVSNTVHAVGTAGVLTATGDNNLGIAGTAWKSQFRPYALSTPSHRSLPLNWAVYLLVEQLIKDRPQILSVSIDQVDTSAVDVDSTNTPELRRLLTELPELLVVVAAGNDRYSGSASQYVMNPKAKILLSGLLRLRGEPAYQNRIIVVAGSAPNNSFWATNQYDPSEGSNYFSDATDIAAPAHDVASLDTLQTSVIRLFQGTSVAAPMVAGTAALLWSMDPALTAAEVREYILNGAQMARNDSLTGALVPAAPIQGYSFYQLDAYGSLQLLSKQRPGAPICGYSTAPSGPWVLLEKGGPLATATDSIKVPGALGALGYVGVAPGGRVLSAYAQQDSLNPELNFFKQSIILFNRQGQRLGGFLDHFGGRHYVEGHIVDHRQLNSGPTILQQLTLRDSNGSPMSIMNLKYPDGTAVGAGVLPWEIDVSPDGRFVAFPAPGGTYVQRFSDQATILLTDRGIPRWNKSGTKLVTIVGDTLYNHALHTFQVDTTAQGGFNLIQTITGSGRLLISGRFTGDDALFYTGEQTQSPTQYFVAARAGAALGTKSAEVQKPWGILGQIGNIARRQ